MGQHDRTMILPGGRVARMVDADEAGEAYAYVEAEPAILWRDGGHITARQAEALMQLARLYTRGGGLTPHRRSSGGWGDHDEADRAAARAEHARLTAAAPARHAWTLLPACQGEWPIGRQMPHAFRASLDAVADALKLPRDAC